MQRAMCGAVIVSIATHTVHSAADRRSMHVCELTRRRGERHAAKTARVAAVSALSDCVEICTRFC